MSLIVPIDLLIAIRWALFFIPIAGVMALAFRARADQQSLIAALFAFLYGLSGLYAVNVAGQALGMWRFGWDAVMLYGTPGDMLIGAALLFGPCVVLLTREWRVQLAVLLALSAANAVLFSVLEPMIVVGPYWWVGLLTLTLGVHLPGLGLAWATHARRYLGLRCFLLAVMSGGFLYLLITPLSCKQWAGHLAGRRLRGAAMCWWAAF